MNATCMQDIDCPGNLVCYQNVTWLDEDNLPGCKCSTWYGWVGENCNEFSSSTIGLACIVFFGVFAGALGILFSIYVLSKLDLKKSTKKGKMIFSSVIISMLSNFFQTIVLISVFGNILNPELATVVLSTDLNGDKSGYLAVLKRFMLIFGSTFTAMSHLNLMLVGIQLKDTLSFFKGKRTSYYQRAKKYVIGVDIVVVLLMGIASVLGFYDIAVLLLMPFWVFIAGGFAYGVSKLADTFKGLASLNSSKEKARRLKQDVAEFRLSAIADLIALVLLIIAAFIFALQSFSGWRNVSPPGKISPAALSSYFLNILVLFANMTVLLLTGRKIVRSSTMESTMGTTTSTNGSYGDTAGGSSFVKPGGSTFAITSYHEPDI